MKKKWILLTTTIITVFILTACGVSNDYAVVVELVPAFEEEALDEIIAEEIPNEDEELSAWHYSNFEIVREPQHLDYDIPHGLIAVNHIEFINDNLYERGSFTVREKETAEWLVEELLAMGYAWDDIEVQEFYYDNVARWMWHGWDTETGRWILGDGELRDSSQNVILTVPGQSERTIIVGAHYDSLPYPGASDNASGVALLLESAQRMLHENNYHTIVYVFFGAEEVGLIGSNVFLRSMTRQELGNLVMMVNADVLFEGPYLMYGAGYALGDTQRVNDISRQVDEIAFGVLEAHEVEIMPVPELLNAGSDHLPFKWAGHTVVVLFGMDMTDDGTAVGRVLHSERDDFHYINQEWPGKIDRNMRYFSIFLEEILLSRYE